MPRSACTSIGRESRSDPNDLLIAAHVLALDLILVTDNVDEFARVPEVVDLWKLLFERIPGGQQLQEGRSGHRFDDEPFAFLMEKGLVAGELKVSRYAQSLVASVPEQAHDPFSLHGVLPAAAAAYARA
ncbi:MAG TPA: hypothetical protein VFE33_10695 [Thermoanaerobaculia bacterium]|nr:hypothetical protein [Thermoanaerobaculia bacterium]